MCFDDLHRKKIEVNEYFDHDGFQLCETIWFELETLVKAEPPLNTVDVKPRHRQHEYRNDAGCHRGPTSLDSIHEARAIKFYSYARCNAHSPRYSISPRSHVRTALQQFHWCSQLVPFAGQAGVNLSFAYLLSYTTWLYKCGCVNL